MDTSKMFDKPIADARKNDEACGHGVRIISEQVGDSGACSHARTKIVDAVTGVMIEGIKSVNLNVSRGQRSVITATVVLEPVSIDVIAERVRHHGGNFKERLLQLIAIGHSNEAIARILQSEFTDYQEAVESGYFDRKAKDG